MAYVGGLVQQSAITGKAGSYTASRSGTGILCFYREPGYGSLSSQTKHSPGKPGRLSTLTTNSGWLMALSAGVNGIYLPRANLDVAFDDNGRQINTLMVRLTGNVAGVMKLFNRCGWQAEPESGASLPHQYSLMARQGVSGKDD